MDRAFQRIRSLMLRGTFYSVPPIKKQICEKYFYIVNILISLKNMFIPFLLLFLSAKNFYTPFI